jgi:MoaA/NifB/PqqE/SkfB family radical SAM enzyme
VKALVVVAVVGLVMATTWRRRGGGLLPLALALVVLSPLAVIGWLGAEWSRRWLARPSRVRRSLAALRLAPLADGWSISARRINKGRMNAVLLVTLTRDGEPPHQIVLKHLLRFGTLLGWAARRFGATPEYPERPGAVARCAREVRALLRLHRRGFRVPACLGYDLRRRVIAMEYVQGSELAPELGRNPSAVDDLGRILGQMHGAHYSMGDANPENMAVDAAGRIVFYDFENSLFGREVTSTKMGFDLAWAGAFLAGDRERDRLRAAYGPCPAELNEAIVAARRHISRFSPLVEWYGRRWRGDDRTAQGNTEAPPVEFLQVEPTTRCNFTCGFCSGRSMRQSDIDVSLFERVLADYPGARHLELQGEGEPLMHPRFFDMITQAEARGLRLSFITNGSYLTNDNVDRILRSRAIDKISVSLESADGATFRAIRGGKLEKVVSGIERLVSERNRLGLRRPVVGFSVTLLRRTAGHLHGIVDLYRRLGLDGGMTAQPLQAMPAYRSTYDPGMQAEGLAPEEIDARMLTFMTRAGALAGRRMEGFYDRLMAGWKPTSRSCPWLDKGLYVNREGVVTPCCMVKDETHALGRVGVDSPGEILARRAKLRAELAVGSTPGPCQGCEIARYAVMGKVQASKRVVAAGLRVLQNGDDVDRPRGDSASRPGSPPSSSEPIPI